MPDDLVGRTFGACVIGWRIRRTQTQRMGPTTITWATGAGSWNANKVRAFLFQTYGKGHAGARGLNHGLRWARAHERHLAEEAFQAAVAGRGAKHVGPPILITISILRVSVHRFRGGVCVACKKARTTKT